MEDHALTPAGLAIMIGSVGTVALVFVWCLARVLRSRRAPEELAKVEPVGEAQIDQR